jgi:hypothetical protein
MGKKPYLTELADDHQEFLEDVTDDLLGLPIPVRLLYPRVGGTISVMPPALLIPLPPTPPTPVLFMRVARPTAALVVASVVVR